MCFITLLHNVPMHCTRLQEKRKEERERAGATFFNRSALAGALLARTTSPAWSARVTASRCALTGCRTARPRVPRANNRPILCTAAAGSSLASQGAEQGPGLPSSRWIWHEARYDARSNSSLRVYHPCPHRTTRNFQRATHA